MLTRFQTRIQEKANVGSAAPAILIVALGDSVTEGATRIGALEPDIVYHAQLKAMLERKRPACVFCVLNAGGGGETAAQGLRRVDRDVIRHDPDLAIVGFCLNDACAGLSGIKAYKRDLGAIVRSIQQKTHAEIVVLTPNWMATHDNEKVAPEHRKFAELLIAVQTGGILAQYADAARNVARECSVALADVYVEWQKLVDGGTDATAMLTNGLNHPDAFGHRIAAETILRVIV